MCGGAVYAEKWLTIALQRGGPERRVRATFFSTRLTMIYDAARAALAPQETDTLSY